VGAILGVGGAEAAEKAEGEEGHEEEEEPAEREELDLDEEEEEEEEEEDEEEEGDEQPEVAAADRIDLNRATFEQLRDLGFSVTQATRVITYRERENGFDSLDELGKVPGMPRQFLREVRQKLTL
jgi:DNA uptake protein ComE-like DNA-binding protein